MSIEADPAASAEWIDWLRTPCAPIPFGTFVAPPQQAEREQQLAQWLNIDPDIVYQSPLGGHPVIVYPEDFDGGSRRDLYPTLDAEAAWFPLLWPATDQEVRYTDETDDEFAIRMLTDMALRNMYDPEQDCWYPAYAVWAATSNESADTWADRVDRWIDGYEDDDLEALEPAPLPDEAERDTAFKHARMTVSNMTLAIQTQVVGWVLEVSAFDPYDTPADEVWSKMCWIADALTPLSDEWAAWADDEMSRLQPVADAAIATGVVASFNRQAARVIEHIRRELIAAGSR